MSIRSLVERTLFEEVLLDLLNPLGTVDLLLKKISTPGPVLSVPRKSTSLLDVDASQITTYNPNNEESDAYGYIDSSGNDTGGTGQGAYEIVLEADPNAHPSVSDPPPPEDGVPPPPMW